MSTRATRRTVLARRLPAAALSAALVASTGAVAGTVFAAPAQAATTVTSPSATRVTGQWLVDQALTTLRDVNTTIGAPAVWARKDASGRPLTGQGVGVALIDSGVAPVKGLGQPGKVVNGPDLSFESQALNLRNQDTFGHGTHMAGIIAGRDPEVATGNENDPRYFVGVAPGAHLVNLRVASADGAVDVSQVIAAIDWAVAHRNDPGVNIRVINLSFGTDSLQDPRYDPLSYAVEAAWRAGIVVVASVGNDGAAATRVGNPALNPYVIAVGGSDTAGTVARTDDTIGAFSTKGNATRHADLVAPGRSIVSLRDRGSFVDVNFPGGLVADATGRYFKGSGTSQAAAVVSGAAALLLQQRPTLTPDQVKKLLTGTAVPMKGVDAIAQGAGQLNVSAAITAATPATAAQTFPKALGTGTLEGARGTAHVADPDSGVELTGERDIMNQPWKPATWTVASASGRAWTGGTWNGAVWAGADWSGTSWAAKTWSSTTWTARSWSGSAWTARSWSSAGWVGDGWDARSWSARSWSARSWSGSYWASRTWQ
ncbi:S8 family serine peptidase [Actinoplanes sp. NPDC023801]|uniref:S8 family serine peptidase n=1 Tax=Actinoplanes sp. NPDC023801 TaxID=3154595 RepID=UPI0033C8F2F7